MAGVSINPMQTTNAAGLFGIKSQGWYQGVALDDPATRYALAGGYVASSETLPMWGGLAITELVPGLVARPVGSIVKRATALGNLTGFTVFNQANNGIVTSQSTVPTMSSDMSVSFYRLGSRARIPLPVSAAVIALQADGLAVNHPLVWNFTAGEIDVFSTISTAADSTALAYSSTTGLVTATTAAAHGLSVGSFVTVSGAEPAQYNGTVQVTSVPSTTTFTYVPVSTPTAAAATTQGSIGVTTESDVVLDVQILGIMEGNCKVVSYDADDNEATWLTNGNLALIRI